MGTTWAEIISNYGLLAIEDIRLEEELRENPAAFLRKMALYMKNCLNFTGWLLSRSLAVALML